MNEQNSITGVQSPVTPEQNTVPVNNQAVAPSIGVAPVNPVNTINPNPLVPETPSIQSVNTAVSVPSNVQPVINPVVQPTTEVQPTIQPVITETPVVPITSTTPVAPVISEPASPVLPVTPNPEQVQTVVTQTPVQPVAPVQQVVQQTIPTPPIAPITTIETMGTQNQGATAAPAITGTGSVLEEKIVETAQNSVVATEVQPQVIPAAPTADQQTTQLFTDQTANTLANGQVAENAEVTQTTADSSNVGFVSTGTPLKKKKSPVIGIVIGVVVAIILALVGYFIVYPFVVKTFFIKPKDIYTAAIKQFATNLTQNVDKTVHDKGIYDLSLRLDTDIPELEEFADYTYGVRFGVDPSKQNLEFGYSIKYNSDEYSNYYYLKNGSTYTRYSTYRDLIYLGESISSEEEMNQYFDSITSILFANEDAINNEDVNYVINKISTLLIETLDEKKMAKEDASISINGQVLKTVRCRYTLDNESIRNTIAHIIEGLSKDDKFIDIVAKVSQVEHSDIKDSLTDSLESIKDYEFEEDEVNKITMGIYTYGNKVEVVGFELAYNDSLNVHYYNKDGNFDFVFTTKTEYDEEYDIESETNTLKAIGVKSGNITNTTISFNDKEMIKLAISAWEENKIEFDYTIIVESEEDEDDNVTGHFLYEQEINDKKSSFSLDFDTEFSDGKLGIEFKFGNDWTSEVANINSNAAVTLTEYDLENINNSFTTYLMDTPLGIIFETISGTQDDDINDYYEENGFDNDYGDDYYYEDGSMTDDSTINSDVIVIQ